jgi:predicted aconitase
MKLSQEEKSMLDGNQGSTLQKVMRSLVLYGEAIGADEFVEIEGNGHFSWPFTVPGVGLRLEMLDELVEAGLKTKYPFTLDPMAPLDFENFDLTPEQERGFLQLYKDQDRYNERMHQLGLLNSDAYTCTPYLADVGNIPKRGAIVAWSETSAVVFVNSVLGAKTNRNAAIMDLFSNIIGKTPLTGFLTDEGRKATWLIEVKTSTLPNPQLLGGLFGHKILDEVPYITGLDRFLGPGLPVKTIDYLKEMGAACGAIGGVGLYHVENITPEAVDYKTDLLTEGYQTLIVRDQELQQLMASYPVMWANPDAKPQRCLIGCPHLSLREIYWWTVNIYEALQVKGRNRVVIPTTIAAAPQVLRKFMADKSAYDQLIGTGVYLSATCDEACMDNPLLANEAVVTNSNKLRAFTTARMYQDLQLLEIITGEKGGRHVTYL